jgi:PBP1b-binding outer membrane lipoprotein LpoB
MKFKKIIILLFSILFLFSCSGAKDALQGKKRSDTSDEFLVEKKNPLTVPPDINELPVPLDQANNQEDIDIKKVLINVENQDTNTESNNGNQNSLEESILERIND